MTRIQRAWLLVWLALVGCGEERGTRTPAPPEAPPVEEIAEDEIAAPPPSGPAPDDCLLDGAWSSEPEEAVAAALRSRALREVAIVSELDTAPLEWSEGPLRFGEPRASATGALHAYDRLFVLTPCGRPVQALMSRDARRWEIYFDP